MDILNDTSLNALFKTRAEVLYQHLELEAQPRVQVLKADKARTVSALNFL